VKPPTSRLFLVRHGEVDAQWRGRIYGDRDVPLSEGGRRQAEGAAEVLADVDLIGVVSSGLARAEFGAQCLRRTRELERVDDPGLREMVRGEWAGKRPDELDDPQAFAAWHADPVDRRPPGGESLGDLARRVLKPGGSFVCKVFQGEGIDEFVIDARRSFERVKVMKPKASRAGSREVYLVARNCQL